MKYTLKVGDKIAKKTSNGLVGILTITHTTPKTAFAQYGNAEARFKQPVDPDDFTEIGADRWNTVSYKIATDEDFHAVKMRNIRIKLRETNWAEVSDSDVQKVYEIIKNKTI